ncbi:DNA-binding transcriptional LysR family regulator [Brevundimonas sp. SORGH_AS 993]|nr:DNA-binding transcriptional LysR family regulator [Brevundimonas sp. SORGH_AS_0993]
MSAHALFAPDLAAFVETYPGITLDLVIDDRFVDTVAEGCDLGVRLGETLRPDMIATRVGGGLTRLSRTPWAPATLEDLAGRRCLHRRPGAGVYRWEVTREGADLVLDALPHPDRQRGCAAEGAVCDGAVDFFVAANRVDTTSETARSE